MPRRCGWAEDLKLLSDYWDQQVAERTRIANRLHADLIVLGLAGQQPNSRLVGLRSIKAVEALLAESYSIRAILARQRLSKPARLDQEARETRHLLTVALRASASTLTEICGVGVLVASRVLGEVGDVGRFRSPNQFAALNGTAPIPASSGRIQRHRLNRGGNRRLNRAIHTVALIQSRVDPRARPYLERRRSEGKTRREAIRSLKRHLSNVIYRKLKFDSRHRA